MNFRMSAAPILRAARMTVCVVALLAVSPAMAQQESSEFDIPAQPLRSALIAFGRQSKVQLLFADELVGNRMAPALSGRLSHAEALARLLEGSGLAPEFTEPRFARLVAAAPAPIVRRAAIEPVQPPQRAEEIIVTGTRIRGATPVGSETIVLDRHQIELTGRGTTAELLRALPQNTDLVAGDEVRVGIGQNVQNTASGSAANLRGLGPATTLVLVNGRRLAPASAGSFVDISQIPLAAIERVEVVADGASSIYGSDAIGGVVNFILRRDFEGAEVAARNEFADGFNRFSASAVAGRSWESGNAVLTYEHLHQTMLRAEDRPFYTSDLRLFGGPDLRASGNVPGTISANGTTYAIPPNQDGRNLMAATLVPGTSNPYDNQIGTSILPTQRRDSFTGAVQQEIGERITLSLDGLYSKRNFGSYFTPPTVSLVVPRSNPFFVSPVPGAQSVNVLYSMREDLGLPLSNGSSQNYVLNAAATMKLGGGWRTELTGSYAADITHERVDNIVNMPRLNAALADPNPATAFNPFAGRSVTNQATLDAIRGYTSDRNQRFRIKSVSLRANGGLFDLPGGTVRMAVGAEYRRESYQDANFALTSTIVPALSGYTNQKRQITSFDAELLIPLFGEGNAIPGLHRLEFSASARSERYSDFGRTTNPKLGMSWRPIEQLTLRGSWGTSFHAPQLNLLGDPTITTAILPDSRSSTGRSNVVALLNNNGALKPETATTWSAGCDYTPSWAPGLRLSATYFAVDYRDRILNFAGADTSLALIRDEIYGPFVTRNPSAAEVQALYDSPFFSPTGTKFPVNTIGAIIDGRYNNVGIIRENGVDISAAWDIETSYGVFTPSLSITWVTDYAVGRSPTAPVVGFLNRSGTPIDLRGRAGLAWRYETYDASLFVNYTNGYRNFTVTPVTTVSSFTTVDAQFGYRFRCFGAARDACRVQVSVQNLFDQAPPFFANTVARVGYDPEQATAVGRITALNFALRF
jgi:iron complex outermembrane recepter protein